MSQQVAESPLSQLELGLAIIINLYLYKHILSLSLSLSLSLTLSLSTLSCHSVPVVLDQSMVEVAVLVGEGNLLPMVISLVAEDREVEIHQ